MEHFTCLHRRSSFSWLRVVAIGLVLLLIGGTVYAQHPSRRVFFQGADGALRTALELAEVEWTDDPADAEVLVLNDLPSNVEEAERLAGEVREGKGLVLILGPHVDSQALSVLLGSDLDLVNVEDAQSLTAPRDGDPLWEEITWNSAPQIRERTRILGLEGEPLVTTFESGEPLLFRVSIGGGVAYIFTPWLSAEANPQIQEWPYFNYLIYHLVERAAGGMPLSYADYPASPVPHRQHRIVITVFAVLLMLTMTTAFVLVRRYSRRHPEVVEQIVADPEKYFRPETQEWEEIGFHRPLAGFLFLVISGLLLFVPLIIYQGVVLPNYIFPSAQGQGTWRWITDLFNSFWIFFDMGTSLAFIKYFSEYRVNNPARGIQYIQFFVWWQATSGTFQLVMVMLVAAYLVPHTAYAYMAFGFIIHALIQVPGFYRVFQYVFQAFQRYAYNQLLNLVATMAPILLQAGVVYFFYQWGKRHPVFGGPMGGILGMGVSLYLVELTVFLWGFWLFKRMGLSARAIFMANFDGQVIKSALRFGVTVMLGNILSAIGNTVQVVLVEHDMVNYAEVMGSWNLCQNLIYAYYAVIGLYQDLMPSLSEAFEHGRYVLSKYYVAQGWKWGGVITFFMASALAGVGDRFILGSLGEEWHRAAELITVLVLWGAIQYHSWLADNVQQGTGHPVLMPIMVGFEQTIRIVLMFFLIRRYQMMGLVIAYFIALPLKNIVTWLLNGKFIFWPKIYWWQSFVVPILAALINYGVIRGAGTLIWHRDQVSSMLLFVFGLLVTLPFYFFLTGLLGGWDDDTLAEFRRAVGLSGLVRPLANLLWHAARLGGRLSPLHGRFPVAIYRAAMDEAASLTAEKVTLH